MNGSSAREEVLQLPELEIAVRRWGLPGGEPVLALHGWLDNAASFDAIAPLMPGVNLCAMDFAGHGRSQHRPPGVHYHLIDNVNEVIGTAEALGWQRFSLLAHSMGAGVGALVAGAFPDRIKTCVFLDGFGPVTSSPEEAPANLRKAVQQMQQPRLRERAVFASLEECARARVRGGHTRVSMAAARVLSERNVRQTDAGFTWRTDPRLRYRSPLRLTEEQVCGFIAAIEAPVLVIQAQDGLAKFAARYQHRIAAAKNVEVRTLAGGHHFHLEEQAAAAAALATRFIVA